MYVIQPILLNTGGVPTPITINGVPDTEFSWPLYITFYCFFTLNTYSIAFFFIAFEAFFALCVIVLGHRLSIISDLVLLLNYTGDRDRTKDKCIIKDCYLMHLEILDKLQVFQTYFNIYGLFQLASPMMINTMLLYNLRENGFDLMSACGSVTFLGQIFLSSFFLQTLQEKVTTYEDLFFLFWIYFINLGVFRVKICLQQSTI